jgi:hypothetical protein
MLCLNPTTCPNEIPPGHHSPSGRRPALWEAHTGDAEFDFDALFLDSRRRARTLRREQPSGRRAGRENDRRREAGNDALYQVVIPNPDNIQKILRPPNPP